jgi:hypothetical protein
MSRRARHHRDEREYVEVAGRHPPATDRAGEIMGAAHREQHSHWSDAQAYIAGRAGAGSQEQPEQVESVYTDLQIQGLSNMQEAEGAQRLMQHNRRQTATLNGYAQKFSLFKAYCDSSGADCYVFSVERAFLFAAFMITRISRTGKPVQSIRTYFSALNYFYTQKKLGAPWQHGPLSDINNMFEKASKVWRIERGIKVGNLRTEFPGAGVKGVIAAAAEAKRQSILHRNDNEHPSHRRVCWFTVFLVQLLFWFRADTIAGYQPGDIRFNAAGDMSFLVRRLKRGSAHIQPFSKGIPAPTTEILAVIFAVIRHAISIETATGTYCFGPWLWGDQPGNVSDKITCAMDELLDYDDLFIPEGSFVSSHSWRKTGASAFAACRGDWLLLMRWGMWKAIASAQAYVNLEYQPDPVIPLIFPWLFSLSGRVDMQVPAALYETEADLADDGVFEPAPL